MNADLKPGTRVQAILLDENHTPLPDMIGTVVPVSEWPASFPEQWTDENTVIVRWDSEEGRTPFTPYRRDVAERVLRETGGLSPLQTFSSTDPAPQDHGPLAATLSERTLAKVLSRPAYVPPGTEPEPFSVEGMHIVSGWLVEPVGEHTCGAGPNGHYGAHEPGCGYEAVARLDDLPGWPGEHASSDIPSIVELDRQQALDSLIANAVAWANGPFGHKALDGALRLAVADYERAVQS